MTTGLSHRRWDHSRHCMTATPHDDGLAGNAIPSGFKSGAPDAPLFVEAGGRQITLTSRVRASTGDSLPRIKARRIGLITNSAISAAVAFSPTAMMNTACQP